MSLMGSCTLQETTCKAISFPRIRSCPSPNRPLNLGQRHFQRHLQVVSMCSCSAWCMITRRVSNPNICRLLMPHCLQELGYEPENSCFKHFLVFACLWLTYDWALCACCAETLCVSVPEKGVREGTAKKLATKVRWGSASGESSGPRPSMPREKGRWSRRGGGARISPAQWPVHRDTFATPFPETARLPCNSRHPQISFLQTPPPLCSNGLLLLSNPGSLIFSPLCDAAWAVVFMNSAVRMFSQYCRFFSRVFFDGN